MSSQPAQFEYICAECGTKGTVHLLIDPTRAFCCKSCYQKRRKTKTGKPNWTYHKAE